MKIKIEIKTIFVEIKRYVSNEEGFIFKRFNAILRVIFIEKVGIVYKAKINKIRPGPKAPSINHRFQLLLHKFAGSLILCSNSTFWDLLH